MFVPHPKWDPPQAMHTCSLHQSNVNQRWDPHKKDQTPLKGFKGWQIYHVGLTPLKAQNISTSTCTTHYSLTCRPVEKTMSCHLSSLSAHSNGICFLVGVEAVLVIFPSKPLPLHLSLSLKCSSPFLSSFYLSLFSSFWSLLEVRVSTFNHFSFLSTSPFPFQNLPPTPTHFRD